MTRSLEGKVFYQCRNNGVTAIVSRATQQNRERRQRISNALTRGNEGSVEQKAGLLRAIEEGLAHIPIGPVFTFANSERTSTSPWFTGGEVFLDFLREYIVANGGRIDESYEFWVPFSNAAETGVHGPGALRAELRHVTTEEDFVKEFGIAREDMKLRR
jgi:hypothetical protein